MRISQNLYQAFVICVFLFILAPLLIIVWSSFFSDKILTFPPTGYSAMWYAHAWDNSAFASGFVTSIKVAFCAAGGALILGVPASLAIERKRFRGRETLRQFLLAPLYVPVIVSGAALYLFYIFFEIASGLPVAGKFWGLVIGHILLGIPWTLRLVCASLAVTSTIPEDAARSLGASSAQVFFYVTLPMVKGGIVAAGLFSFIISFSNLEVSLFLVGAGETTLPIAILNYLEWSLDPTVAAVATVQIAIIAVALLIAEWFVNVGKSI